jgi:hypothetical protein
MLVLVLVPYPLCVFGNFIPVFTSNSVFDVFLVILLLL